MYTDDPDFDAPGDNDLLWRYFDLARYLDLLIRERLFFSSVENMEDPFEGWAMENGFRRNSEDQDRVVVSSWHSNEEENYAMWKIYAQGSAGLAIQTRFSRLRDAFHPTDKRVRIGKVVYYRGTGDMAGAAGESLLKPYLQKRNIYAFEKEVRCCYRPEGNGNEQEVSEAPRGVYLSVDLDRLIERIYISPYAPEWFRQLIGGVNKKFGVKKEIVHSDVFGGRSDP
ncbi:MAG TPA: hypothetical protein VHW43_06890 [Puia sp.]|nr:hypothetical protein [Puia sp.]